MLQDDFGLMPANSSSKKPLTAALDLPWVEKYRPESLDQVVSQQEIVSTLSRFIEMGKLPHLLFYGPPGTGKTSTALAVSRALGLKRGQVLELNASDERGIEVVRNEIKQFAATQAIGGGGGLKVVILDECDAMTSAAQSALRRIMEKWVKQVRFILCCNYASQLIPAIQSRCTRFRFSPLSPSQMQIKLLEVLQSEQVQMTDAAQQALIRLAQGDMRRVLNGLQACAACSNIIDEDLVYAVTAAPHPADLQAILDALLTKDIVGSIQYVRQLQQSKALATIDLVRGVYERLDGLQMSVPMRIYLVQQLAEMECRLATSSVSDTLQIAALAGLFFTARALL